MTYSESDYLRERAICDTAAAYWRANASYAKRDKARTGASSMAHELCAHPDYAACTNDMRGRVEQFEILRDMPDSIGAYLSREDDGRLIVSVWTGNALGAAVIDSSRSTPRSHLSSRYYYGRATINGVAYHWRGAGVGMYCTLRKAKARRAAAQ